jgi:hypothetical protein
MKLGIRISQTKSLIKNITCNYTPSHQEVERAKDDLGPVAPVGPRFPPAASTKSPSKNTYVLPVFVSNHASPFVAVRRFG